MASRPITIPNNDGWVDDDPNWVDDDQFKDDAPIVPQNESVLHKAWNTLTTPMADIRSATPEVKAATDAFAQQFPMVGKPMNFAIDTLSGLSSPLDVGTAGLFGGAGTIAKMGLPKIANTMIGAGRAGSALTGLEGTENILEGNYGTGLLELAGARAGMRTKPHVTAETPAQAAQAAQANIGKVTLKKPSPELISTMKKRGFEMTEVLQDGNAVFTRKPKIGLGEELYNLPRLLTASVDLSAPLRQGLTMASRGEWWKAWPAMVKSYGSAGAYSKVLADIDALPTQAKTLVVPGKSGKQSLADLGGLDVTDLVTKQEEGFVSNWAGKIPGVKNSERAYSAFLNKLRADTFDNLVDNARKMGKPVDTDITLLKQIGDYVNNATGRGSLGRFEPAAKILSDTLFSPRLMASRVQMMNPANYLRGDKNVRLQYLRSLLTAGGTWLTVAGLAKASGLADVSLDPTNSDFGKVKIGDARLDPAGGFQQYLVAIARASNGQMTSPTSGRTYDTGHGYKATTLREIGQNFMENKLHPALRFAYDIADASEYKPFNFADRTLQLFIPLLAQDIMDLYKEDPKLLPLAGLAAVGMGTQTFSKSNTDPSILPEEPLQYEGGSLPELYRKLRP